MSFKWSNLLRLTFAGLAVFSKAAGAYPWRPPEIRHPHQVADWAVLRDRQAASVPTVELNPELARFISGADLDKALEQAIRRSYAMATAGEIRGLDTLWIEVLTRRADSAEIGTFLRVRGDIAVPEVGGRDYYLENWLWQTGGGGGDCDGGPGGGHGGGNGGGHGGGNGGGHGGGNGGGHGGGNGGGHGGGNGGGQGNNGHGNGDQDAPGNSGNNNNAENAGGNHDGTGSSPGNSGSNGNNGNNGNQGNNGNNGGGRR